MAARSDRRTVVARALQGRVSVERARGELEVGRRTRRRGRAERAGSARDVAQALQSRVHVRLGVLHCSSSVVRRTTRARRCSCRPDQEERPSRLDHTAHAHSDEHSSSPAHSVHPPHPPHPSTEPSLAALTSLSPRLHLPGSSSSAHDAPDPRPPRDPAHPCLGHPLARPAPPANARTPAQPRRLVAHARPPRQKPAAVQPPRQRLRPQAQRVPRRRSHPPRPCVSPASLLSLGSCPRPRRLTSLPLSLAMQQLRRLRREA